MNDEQNPTNLLGAALATGKITVDLPALVQIVDGVRDVVQCVIIAMHMRDLVDMDVLAGQLSLFVTQAKKNGEPTRAIPIQAMIDAVPGMKDELIVARARAAAAPKTAQ